MSVSAKTKVIEGVKLWGINPNKDEGVTQILISRSSAMFDSVLELAELFGGSATPVDYHGYTAYNIIFVFFGDCQNKCVNEVT